MHHRRGLVYFCYELSEQKNAGAPVATAEVASEAETVPAAPVTEAVAAAPEAPAAA